MAISAVGECAECSKQIKLKCKMKFSVFSESGEFTVVGLTKTCLQTRLLELSALGECAKPLKENKRIKKIWVKDKILGLSRRILDPSNKV
jgi:hypothetical protein